MKPKRISRLANELILVLVAAALVGCKGGQSTPAAAKSLGDTYTSPAFDTSYPGALNAASQLMLGTLRLEGTENAVTPEQAKTLLVLWQALPGRVLQSDAERNAVLAYIETQMTPAQLKAIAAMRLTQNDLSARPRDDGQGLGLGQGRAGAGQRGTPGALPAPGGAFPGGGGTPPGMGTRQAQFGRATPRSGDAVRGTNNGVSIGSAQDMVLLNSLIRLLTQKAEGGAAPSPANRVPNRAPAATALPSPAPTEP